MIPVVMKLHRLAVSTEYAFGGAEGCRMVLQTPYGTRVRLRDLTHGVAGLRAMHALGKLCLGGGAYFFLHGVPYVRAGRGTKSIPDFLESIGVKYYSINMMAWSLVSLQSSYYPRINAVAKESGKVLIKQEGGFINFKRKYYV